MEKITKFNSMSTKGIDKHLDDSSMESKIYSRAEIEAMLAGDYERFPFEDAPAIIRQLLQQNQELQAKVDEAAKIEELLKECDISYGEQTLVWDQDLTGYWGSSGTYETMGSWIADSLHAALTSLVGGGK